MDKLVVRGRKRLTGEVTISGAKNAAVAVIPAAVMATGVSVLENLPSIEDVRNICHTIQEMGGKCRFVDKHTLEIDCNEGVSYQATFEGVQKMRASYYLIGALLARYKKAEVAMPGGCNFGKRPIDLHLKGFRALGATVIEEDGMVKAYAEKLIGTSIYMDQVSVGATINVMLAATMAEGTTTIENAAKEPHVVDTANYLNMMGANIKGAGTDVIRIKGVSELKGAQYTIIPDQIEAGTYMIAAAITGGDVLVKNVTPKHLEPITAKLRRAGIEVEEFDDAVRVRRTGDILPLKINTMPHPGFPTDMQPLMGVLLSVAKGTSTVTESVWDNRFRYVDELRKMGANVQVDGQVAVFEGVEKLSPAPLRASDLRAGAAMVVAALMADGTSEIEEIGHIERGYENIVEKLRGLGADIKKVERMPAALEQAL